MGEAEKEGATSLQLHCSCIACFKSALSKYTPRALSLGASLVMAE